MQQHSMTAAASRLAYRTLPAPQTRKLHLQAGSLGNIFLASVLAVFAALWIYGGTTADPERVAALVASAQKCASASDLVRFELAQTPAPTIWQLSSLRRRADEVLALDVSKAVAGLPTQSKRNPS